MDTAAGYNEAFDENGSLRAPYRAFRNRTGRDPFQPAPETVAALARSPLGDRYTILPIPLILNDLEYRETIARGVRQRALALQSLFWDVVQSREPPLPAEVLQRSLEQEGTSARELAALWKGKTRAHVRFTYAPDLMRDPEGRWSIVEDNVGCVGGVVDSRLVVERFLAHTGTSLDARVTAAADLVRAVREFLEENPETPASDDVLVLADSDCDPEARRKLQVLRAAGFRVVDGQELQRTHGAEIGAIVNFRMTDHLRELFGERGLPLMTAPGIDFLGNKLLLPFMDSLVAFYSGEEPVLRTARTELFQNLPDRQRQPGWILKKSSGCQGKEVIFLEDLNDAQWNALETTINGWGGPDWAVLQRRVCASFLPIARAIAWHWFQIELRPIVFVVGDRSCIVSDHPSGRALSNLDGRRLGNMSQGAHYVAVLREPSV